MVPPALVALIARSDTPRIKIADYLRDGGFTVMECDDMLAPTKFAGIVIVDDRTLPEPIRTRVETWLELGAGPRIVVVSIRPAAWRHLCLLYDRLAVLAAPAFGWEIVDALRAAPSELPTS